MCVLRDGIKLPFPCKSLLSADVNANPPRPPCDRQIAEIEDDKDCVAFSRILLGITELIFNYVHSRLREDRPGGP